MAREKTDNREQRGAAVVEFALVMPILLTIFFGIVQYGLWFNDSLNIRQGVRETARMGVVGNFGSTANCAESGAQKLACEGVNQIDALMGEEYVKVTAASWTRGQPLVVCSYVKTEGGVGLLPMPNDGWIFSRTEMSIENESAAPAVLSGISEALPTDAPAWPAGC